MRQRAKGFQLIGAEVVGMVVKTGEAHRVCENAEDYEVLEPFPFNQPDGLFPSRAVLSKITHQRGLRLGKEKGLSRRQSVFAVVCVDVRGQSAHGRNIFCS